MMENPFQTLAGAFAMFASEFLIDAPPAVRTAMGRAFYSGAGASLAVLYELSIARSAAANADADADALNKLDALFGEIERFITDLQQHGKRTANAKRA